MFIAPPVALAFSDTNIRPCPFSNSPPFLAVLAVLALAGCGGSDEPETGRDRAEHRPTGAPGQPSQTLSPDELKELELPPHSKEDIAFMKAVIHPTPKRST